MSFKFIFNLHVIIIIEKNAIEGCIYSYSHMDLRDIMTIT